MNFLKQAWNNYKKHAAEKRHARGYAYAAYLLLHEHKTVPEVDMIAVWCDPFGDTPEDPFDEGMRECISDFRSTQLQVQNACVDELAEYVTGNPDLEAWRSELMTHMFLLCYDSTEYVQHKVLPELGCGLTPHELCPETVQGFEDYKNILLHVDKLMKVVADARQAPKAAQAEV